VRFGAGPLAEAIQRGAAAKAAARAQAR
jgi:hypothetical protein